jgi:hypothetical protein
MRGRGHEERGPRERGPEGNGRGRTWDDPTEFRAMGPSARGNDGGAAPPRHGWDAGSRYGLSDEHYGFERAYEGEGQRPGATEAQPDTRGWHGEPTDTRGEARAAYQGRSPQPRSESGFGSSRPPEEGWGWSPSRGGGERAGGDGYERMPELVGKGPKGYTRSDERVREHVCERLSEGYLDASEIEVTVEKGAVSLTGTVADKRAKRVAEDLAEGCPGVVEVDNRLRVRAGARRA